MPGAPSNSGFDFGNYSRNNFLGSKGYPVPKATSTGTTIVGCIFKDGVVLGADTRATEGPIVADKNCEKVRIVVSSCSGEPTILTNCVSTCARADSLHFRQYSLLWSRNSGRHGVCHCPHFQQYAATRASHWQEAESGDCNDHAEAEAVPVSAHGG